MIGNDMKKGEKQIIDGVTIEYAGKEQAAKITYPNGETFTTVPRHLSDEMAREYEGLPTFTVRDYYLSKTLNGRFYDTVEMIEEAIVDIAPKGWLQGELKSMARRFNISVSFAETSGSNNDI